MVRFTDSNVVDDYPPRQPSRNGRWSPDYHYAGGAAPPSPGGSVRGGSGGGGPYMSGPFPAPTTQAPPAPVLTRENSLHVPHWDRYRPRSVPPPLSPTNDNSTIAFPPSRPRSRNHDRDYDRDRDRDRHEDRSSRRRPATDRERETKGRQRERYYDSDSSSSDNDDRKSNKPSIARSRTPLSKARHALSSTFSDSTTGLGAGVIGAIVGGLAAREASENLLAKGDGHRHGDHHSGKEALLSTIAGAAVGALGANAIEKRIEASRNKKNSSSSSAAATSPSKGSDDGRNYTWGHERRRSSTIEDKRDNRDRDGGRDRETYKERDLRRDRSQRRGSKDEDRDRERERHRYHTTDDESEDEIVYDHNRRRALNRDRDRSRPPRREDDWR